MRSIRSSPLSMTAAITAVSLNGVLEEDEVKSLGVLKSVGSVDIVTAGSLRTTPQEASGGQECPPHRRSQ
jgi:hypothetical protein